MKRFFVALSFFWLTTGATALAQERGWRGLVPLHSTRADVERQLGQPTEVLSIGDFYRTPNETLIINYFEGLPCGIGEKYSEWRVPRNTLRSIYVSPIKPLPLSELALDESKYKKWSGGHRIQDIYYINAQEGVELRVFMGEVMNISLFAGRIDKHLRCYPLPPELDCEGEPASLRDVYREMPFSRERKRLDNFAVLLLRNPSATGYIIVYAGKSARVGEAKALAERDKRYLVKIRNVPLHRLKIIDGGHRIELEVHLYTVSSTACPPFATPTFDPRDVRIIKSRKH